MVTLTQALRPDEIEELKGLQDYYGNDIIYAEYLDGDSLVRVIEHIDEEIFENIGSYCAQFYRPGGEGSHHTNDWKEYVKFNKELNIKLSSFKLKLMEAESWFDEQGLIDQSELKEHIKEKNPEDLSRHEKWLQEWRETNKEDTWLPERKLDEEEV